jgi:hypothetical protein
MKRALLVLLLAAGCGGMEEPMGTSETMPGQETALAIVWQELGVPPVAVELRWVHEQDWNCGDGTQRFRTPAGCAHGATSLDRRVVRSIWTGPRVSNVSDILAHELLCHVAGRDDSHTGECAPSNEERFHDVALAVFEAGL